MDLITEKELESIQQGESDGTNEYGSSAGGGSTTSIGTHEIMVPKQAVCVVIGKSGDMIQQIQQDSGAKVQFLKVNDEGLEDKVCIVTGSAKQIQAAANFINDLIQSVLVRDEQNVDCGSGRRHGDGSTSNHGSEVGKGRPDVQELHYAVPGNKWDLVIGKDAHRNDHDHECHEVVKELLDGIVDEINDKEAEEEDDDENDAGDSSDDDSDDNSGDDNSSDDNSDDDYDAKLEKCRNVMTRHTKSCSEQYKNCTICQRFVSYIVRHQKCKGWNTPGACKNCLFARKFIYHAKTCQDSSCKAALCPALKTVLKKSETKNE